MRLKPSTLLLLVQLVAVVVGDVCPHYIVQPGDDLESIASKKNLDPSKLQSLMPVHLLLTIFLAICFDLTVHHTPYSSAAVLTSAIEACGMFADDLSPGITICLPGSELSSCRNVRPFNGTWDCKYYVMQLGDSISSVAFSLNVYQPDLEEANLGLDAENLKEGDLIVMPPWDTKKCGILPPTLEQLNSGIVVQPPSEAPPGPASPTPENGNVENSPSPGAQPSSPSGGSGSGQESSTTSTTTDPVPRAPPTTDQPSSPSPGGGDTSTSPGSSPGINNGGAPSTTSPGSSPDAATMPEKCRGFRARESDDLYSIAALFGVEVTLLVSVNPDLGEGFPIVPGAMIKIPPYDATCSFPTIVDASQIPYSPSTPLDAFAVRPGNFTSGSSGTSKPSNGPAPAPVTYVEIGSGDYYGTDGSSGDSSSGGSSSDPRGSSSGDITTISEDNTIIQNIVADGGNSNAPLPKQSAVNPGSIMMGSFVFVGALAVFAMLGLAFSGTAPMRLSMKKFKINREAENASNNV